VTKTFEKSYLIIKIEIHAEIDKESVAAKKSEEEDY
jgi:hypothetical protein